VASSTIGHDLREPRIDARQLFDTGEGAARGGVRIAFVGVVQKSNRGLRGFRQAPTIGMAIAFFTQIGDFAFLRSSALSSPTWNRSISLRESRSRALPSSSTVRLTSAIQVLCASRTCR